MEEEKYMKYLAQVDQTGLGAGSATEHEPPESWICHFSR